MHGHHLGGGQREAGALQDEVRVDCSDGEIGPAQRGRRRQSIEIVGQRRPYLVVETHLAGLDGLLGHEGSPVVGSAGS